MNLPIHVVLCKHKELQLSHAVSKAAAQVRPGLMFQESLNLAGMVVSCVLECRDILSGGGSCYGR